MTTLKITDRDKVLASTLKDAFEPRFAALLKSAEALLSAQVKNNDPRFVALLADPEVRPYLATGSSKRAYIEREKGRGIPMCRPVYGSCAEIPADYYVSTAQHVSFHLDTIVPCSMRDFIMHDARVLANYAKAWSDYTAAYSKLSAVLNSYTQREKLIADFPEFEAHLPPLPVKVKLPAVIVKDVRRDLKKSGVPA